MVAEEDGEGFGEVAGGGVLVVADEQALEERLVHAAADLGAGREVGPVAVLAEPKGDVEGFLDVDEELCGGVEARGRGLHLVGDALLFGAEQVGRDGVVVVGLEELAAYGDHIPRSWTARWFAADWAFPRPVDQSKELCVRARGT